MGQLVCSFVCFFLNFPALLFSYGTLQALEGWVLFTAGDLASSSLFLSLRLLKRWVDFVILKLFWIWVLLSVFGLRCMWKARVSVNPFAQIFITWLPVVAKGGGQCSLPALCFSILLCSCVSKSCHVLFHSSFTMPSSFIFMSERCDWVSPCKGIFRLWEDVRCGRKKC